MASESKVQEMFASALRQHQAGRLAEAEQFYLQTLQMQPGHPDAMHLLGVLAHQMGRHSQAVELIRQAISGNPRVPGFHNNLGNAYKALGNLREAVNCFQSALALKPDYAEAHFNLAATFQSQGRFGDAVSSYQQALAVRPGYLEAHLNLGNTLHAQGRLAAAEQAFRSALALNPNHADALNNLGNILRAQGQQRKAVDCYRQALLHKPEHAQAHHNLGVAYFDLGQLDEAQAAFSRALRFSPSYPQAYYHLGNSLRELGHSREAAAAYRDAIKLLPQYAEAQLALAVSTVPIYVETVSESHAAAQEFAVALADLTAWHDAHPGLLGGAIGTSQPFYLAYRPENVTPQLLSYGQLASRAASQVRPEVFVDRSRRGDRTRIRMVIVTAHVRRHHPVWDIVLRGLIANLDRATIELYLYHTSSASDEAAVWASGKVDRYVHGTLPVGRWLDEIRQDRPDVIFYPEIGMDPIASALAALRLAPLQVASWGHPITSGLPTIDWFVSGELLESAEAEHHYSETLLRLPGTGVCTQTEADEVQPWRGPERERGRVRLCICQQPIKFDPADDALLARIAKGVPGCEVWLVTPDRHVWAASRLQNRLARALESEGVNAGDVLKVTPWMSRGEFSGFLSQMDVYLDLPAFSGYTTAWQAVHCGLPIVTLPGEFLRQRLAAGLLRQLDMTDGIVSSREEYISRATQFALEAQAGAAQHRRDALQGAAVKADGNMGAVRVFESLILKATKPP